MVTGLVPVGDAWACTNPSLGRGATIGFVHARVLRDVLRSPGSGHAEELVRTFDVSTQREVAPLFEASVTFTGTGSPRSIPISRAFPTSPTIPAGE